MNALALFNSPQQWLILIIVCLVIFGAKRLPEIARGLGRSLGEIKKARRDIEQELLAEEKQRSTPEPTSGAIEVQEVKKPEADENAR